ncbi:MAG TPA: biotin carboxylase N-terminal domain-containing protein [Polyangiaceae bacterium]|nr:biotin carboxylase N-terminal domain-containing protein [Polyangiaceae bacterium]
MAGKVLIANRGEIAVRIARALREMSLPSVAVYTDADQDALHIRATDEAVRIGEGRAAYLDAERIVSAARRVGAWGIHPGYGFLSESAELCSACERAGLTFIGPPASAIHAMGDKTRARERMGAAGVPVVPGGPADNLAQAKATAAHVGYPVLLKASAGGGGKGMRRVDSEDELARALERTQSEAEKSFGDGTVYIEKAITSARHVEIQVLGDRHGNLVHLFERDCSLQRRHQKIIEETPCPALSEATRAAMCQVALTGARAIGYYSAGTFEFLLGGDQSFYFLEMNTRLQVEHPITELATGVDLVQEMVRIADGQPLSFSSVERRGVALEARVYAEDPAQGFMPAPGRIELLAAPAGPFVRNDSGVSSGSWVSPEFDPMLSKLCVWAPTRELALARMRRALSEYTVLGVATNLEFLERLLAHPRVLAGDYDTNFVEQNAAALCEDTAPEEQQWRDALLLTALAAQADSEARLRGSTPDSATNGSRWRDAQPKPVTRFR